MRQIRDQEIPREKARSNLLKLSVEARDVYYNAGGKEVSKAEWFFPVAGLDTHAIAGGRRHGYSARGYDFFTGNRHGGHPSLDIFIRDRNHDCCDDFTGKPVQVLSMTAGLVVAAEDTWAADSNLRGGKYLWIYDPVNDLLVYYAHNERLLVGVGELVRPGDVIATVGRSGYNAAKKRSPTHLHLTVLKVDGGTLSPVDVYSDLRKVKRLKLHDI
ncbi:MAG: M23 family metallopeptidase [Desulfuromonadaceae bacterium]|nr:M23 family metallopeptidase [Desulfuromonadaceae bacterium]MDD5107308.1 M23 family metallopeptidase [Desulfuromonadaceae bacterium]